MSINKKTKKLFTKDKRLKFFTESNNQNFVNKNHSNKFLLNNAKFSKVKDFNSITKTSSSDQNSSSNLNLIKKIIPSLIELLLQEKENHAKSLLF